MDVGIIGLGQSGKTTVFNAVTGFVRPQSGRIVLFDREITGLAPHRRARLGFGRTFQISQTLTTLTVLENAMVGAFLKHPRLTDAARHAQAILNRVGLGGRAGIKAGSLTLSERRRLEVARALALEPRIILLDEVMAGLNQTEVNDVIHLVQSLVKEGLTILLIEHNLKVVRVFSRRVIVLDRGGKLAEGTAEEVLADPAVVEAYVGRRDQ